MFVKSLEADEVLDNIKSLKEADEYDEQEFLKSN